jgi:hypothetical protein
MRFRNNNRRKGRRNAKANYAVPINVQNIGFDHSFTESGGAYQIDPPAAWSSENKVPVRLSSIRFNYASAAPCTLRVALTSDGGAQFITIPLLSSVTCKEITLKQPRYVDFSYQNFVTITASGPAHIAGSVVFVSKEDMQAK